MKRYLCTVAAGFVLALASTATASADIGLPLPGQSGEQSTYFGDQSVEKQENDADVTQEQGNGNVNIAPAIAVFGDAETSNEQGNDNKATSEVDQENDVDQSQSSEQDQSLDRSDSKDGCCDGQSQAGEQRTYGGDQTVEKQENDADVTQEQGNGNVNIAPAIAVFGDAETSNEQGNDNVAKSYVEQENDVDQSQSSSQEQDLATSAEASKGYDKKDEKGNECCEPAKSQTGKQKTSFGDQTVGKQQNDADVTQKQGNDNVSIAPAVSVGGSKGDKHASCSKCEKSRRPYWDKAKTSNSQGNDNTAKSDVEQSNDVDQSQSATQEQELTSKGGDCCKSAPAECEYGRDDGHECKPKKDECHGRCKPAPSQSGEQQASFGDQSVGKQENDADVTQKQGNGNVNIAPAIAVFGDAETSNEQGNDNKATSEVDQRNYVDQSQTSWQSQSLVEECVRLIQS